jgi:hypothetical protein
MPTSRRKKMLTVLMRIEGMRTECPPYEVITIEIGKTNEVDGPNGKISLFSVIATKIQQEKLNDRYLILITHSASRRKKT